MPKLVKALVWIVVIAVSVVVLFTTVFPWVEEQQQDPTLGLPAIPADVAAPIGGWSAVS